MKTLPLAVETQRHKSLHSLAFLTTSLLFLAATTCPLATGFGSLQGPIFKPLPFHTTESRSPSKFMVATEQTVETDSFPELGKGGVYHITTPEQHHALLEMNKDKLLVMKVFAPWCRACKGLEPKFNAIVKDPKYKDLPIIWADLSIQNNKNYVKSIGVVALPSIQFYAQGMREDTFPCGPSKVPILKRKLSEFVQHRIDKETRQLTSVGKQKETTATETKVFGEVDKSKDATAQSYIERERSNLRSIPYFTTMLESEFESVLSRASLLTFESGALIMREGNVGSTFYVIVEGEVEICQKTSFEDPLTTPPTYLGTVINRFVQGEYFGERALITGEPRAASIRTSSLTRCLVFDAQDFPSTCILSGKSHVDAESEMQSINEKYGVTLSDITTMNDNQYLEAQKANQARGSVNSPRPIDGVDNDSEEDGHNIGVETDTVVPLLMRFKLIRLVTRCFDYMVANTPRLGDQGARRRRNMLVQLLSSSQQSDFNDAYNLLDADGDGEITLIEFRRLVDSIGEEKSDEELQNYIEKGNQKMDGKQVISYEDFMGIMAEAEFYHLFLETFRALDKEDSGYLRAGDLNRVLCGVRDLITDDRKSIIDVEDDDMSIDYEQFSKMLLGIALK
ncbi:unnamed protein product [Cylindrotheca closterium]|uniref:Calmodulin n=1 Tax=Cylindrotheca closterium TaxID=2856 RepID=A0AAD2FR49_9STRA|nr:unnamed protein product [Cylindrotheca closterium]